GCRYLVRRRANLHFTFQASTLFLPVLIILAEVRLMSGKDFQEEAMLAAVRHLKAVQSSADYTGPFEQSDTSAVSEEPTSLEVLFREHHDRVFRTAHRVTGSAADAEDVLQTVFLRVARGQESIGFAENPQAYFARAAINASLDLLRSRKRTKTVSFDTVENQAGAFASKHNPETGREGGKKSFGIILGVKS